MTPLRPVALGATVLLVGLFGPAGHVPAQTTPLDADRASLQAQTLSPNATHDGHSALVITGPMELDGRDILVEAPGGGRCDLVLANGSTLRVADARLRVRGDVVLEEGGAMHLERVDCVVLNSYPREHNYKFEGGLLHTQDCYIGGTELANGAVQIAGFWLYRGHWTVRNTTVQNAGAIMMGYRNGYLGDPALSGGTLDADGLFRGKSADFLTMWGKGDATIRNSTYSLNLGFWADTAGAFELDLRADAPIQHRVYGDAAVHDALKRDPVNVNVPGSPWRLQLDNVRVPLWSVAAHGVQQSGPAVDITLRNAEKVALRLLTQDLQGSPTLTGPWRTHYPEPRRLPGLPSADTPGEHGMPPGCGVRVGNLTFKAPSDQWAHPANWAFNFKGSATNYAIRGAMSITEIFMADSQVTLEGDAGYNAGLRATTFDLHGDARLQIRNARLGSTGSFQPELLLRGRSVVDVEDVLVENLLLRSAPGGWGATQGIDASRFTFRDFHETGDLRVQTSGATTVQLVRANPDQSFDRTNLDFEDGVRSGRPEYWSGSNLSGTTSSTHRSASPGSRSFAYKSSSSSGNATKSIPVTPGATVEFSGWLRARNLPNNGRIEVFARGTNSGDHRSEPALQVGQWTYFHLPPVRVANGDSAIQLGVSHQGTNGQLDVLLDDFDVRIYGWWDSDNLANLDLDDDVYRNLGSPPGEEVAPNHWIVTGGTTSAETVQVRPAAESASSSTRFVPSRVGGQLYKSLSFLEPGQTVTVRGWLKGLPHGGSAYRINVNIGEDNGRSWDSGYGNNQHVWYWDGAWQQFQLTYVVPSPPIQADATRFSISTSVAGATVFLDDVSVEIR